MKHHGDLEAMAGETAVCMADRLENISGNLQMATA